MVRPPPRPDPPVDRIFAALEAFEAYRDPVTGMREGRLPSELGVIHAMRQREGAETRGPEFFEALSPFALCGRHVKVRMPSRFREDEEGVCLGCAKLVRDGLRRPSDSAERECGEIVRPELLGFSQVVACVRPYRHDGAHRTQEGGTWQSGPDDFTPTGDYSV